MLTVDGITISSNGRDIPVDLYRELTDHTALLHNGDALRQAMRDDGYVFLRGVLDADEQITAGGDEILAIIDKLSELSVELKSVGHAA